MADDRIWLRFALAMYQVKVSELVTPLLQNGAKGLQMLQQMGTLLEHEMRPRFLGPCYLPWYRRNGDQSFWDDVNSIPLTVEDWTNLRKTLPLEKVPEWQDVNRWLELRKWPDDPIVVVHDSLLGVSLIVDGCHRACASSLMGLPAQVMVYRSTCAHLLFPKDFFFHLREYHKRMEAL